MSHHSAPFELATSCNVLAMYNFAELMLPDGAHKRDEDTTVFMLRRSPLVKNAGGANHLREV